jgi:hypothetical protein
MDLARYEMPLYANSTGKWNISAFRPARLIGNIISE